MHELEALNKDLILLFEKLEKTTAEDESADDLVSQLQEMILKRQFLLQKTEAGQEDEDRYFLNKELRLSQEFLAKATALRDHRQQLLHAGSKSKRQLNVYRTIDANR
ncbi:hypothetical protein SHAM105786_14045 [Shewanella amazonensis]|uniref:Flagella biosynthesis chaperone for FliD, FliT n=1 Tax=Shewanella amazonensis (strain ATCC BAA-1098 / SB2B) TaxID=326297 RepID=A1S802_SHEAM|nr:hypothetical protein [Shewanella amazonensis]ABM00509.1 conserved hypothetical protein [Shewanella amazonensis SB2B]